jgi:hypothetical protein
VVTTYQLAGLVLSSSNGTVPTGVLSGTYAAGMGKDPRDTEDATSGDDPKHAVEDDKATGKQSGDIDPSQYPPEEDE